MKVNHLNALLVEILMAVLFFALSAAVILQVFATAHDMGNRSDLQTAALNRAQNLSEQLYAADDMEAMLADARFESCGEGCWHLSEEMFTLLVRTGEEPAPAGTLLTATVSVAREDEILVELPCSRYVPEVAA